MTALGSKTLWTIELRRRANHLALFLPLFRATELRAASRQTSNQDLAGGLGLIARAAKLRTPTHKLRFSMPRRYAGSRFMMEALYRTVGIGCPDSRGTAKV